MRIHVLRRPALGLGLIELMITVSIFAVLLAVSMMVIFRSDDALNWERQDIALQKDLRKILDQMVQEIREASPSSPNPITVGNNSIAFQIPATVAGNQVTAWTPITYGIGQFNNVVRTVNGQVFLLGSNIQGLQFTYPLNPNTAPRTVRIQVTGQRVTTEQRIITGTATAEAILRNP